MIGACRRLLCVAFTLAVGAAASSAVLAQSAPVVRGPNAPALVPAAAPSDAGQTAPANTVRSATSPALAPSAAPAPVGAAPPEQRPATTTCPGNPNALGVSRIVEIDTTGGPAFGSDHFRLYDFLRPGEIVLTFDDGPWPRNTPAVLAALASHCTKAMFFPIGKHALWHPDILKQVAEQGHTIGSHTWSHVDLAKKGVDGKAEIEKGASAVKLALGAPPASFVRFPVLHHPPAMLTYAAERNIAVFSADVDSFDFKTKKPEAVIQTVLKGLAKSGKGIVLMHDFQTSTATALPMLLEALKQGGYRVVQVRAKAPLPTLAAYDAEVATQLKGAPAGGTANMRPLSSVVRTVGE